MTGSDSGGLILGIETSCDETAAAIVRRGRDVLAETVWTQHEVHRRFGGIVPELASRAHVERILPVLDETMRAASVGWRDLSAIAVTAEPGLIGSLLIGLTAGKALAWSTGVPLIGVNHVHAHLYAALLNGDPLDAQALGLVVSGGHSSLFRLDPGFRPREIGRTIDDAVGEAFDKAATILGLGQPGGPAIDRLARCGNDRAIDLPVAQLGPGRFDFSFSGLKTALLYAVEGVPAPPNRVRRADSGRSPAAPEPLDDTRRRDFAASFERAAIRAVTRTVDRALDTHDDARVLIAGGGVTANSRLRQELALLCERRGVTLRLPPPRWCLDNAAMIAGIAWRRAARGEHDDLALPARAVVPR